MNYNNLNIFSKFVKDSLYKNHYSYLSPIIDLHKEFNIPCDVRKVPSGTLEIRTSVDRKDHYNIFKSTPSFDAAPFDTIKLNLKHLRITWNFTRDALKGIPEFKKVLLSQLEYGIYNKLGDCPIQFIDTEKSCICVAEPTVEFHALPTTINIMLYVDLRIGLGISKNLKERAFHRCKQHCPRCVKCMLIPQQCYLKWLIHHDS